MEESNRQGHSAMEEKVQIYGKSRYKEQGLADMATPSRNKETKLFTVVFLLGYSRASEYYVPTFRNTVPSS